MNYRIDGETVSLGSGDGIFLKKGCLRERMPCSSKVDYVSFNFYTEEELTLPRYLAKSVRREIKLLLAACDEIKERPGEGNERRLGIVLEAILELIGQTTAHSYSQLTERILRYLHTHLSERITLEQVGKEMHFSPVYCDTVFKRETGRSIVAYLLDERMEEAKRLLLEDMLTLRKIAQTVGFEDYNYVSRCFKARVGYTPTQYRKQMRRTYGG